MLQAHYLAPSPSDEAGRAAHSPLETPDFLRPFPAEKAQTVTAIAVDSDHGGPQAECLCPFCQRRQLIYVSAMPKLSLAMRHGTNPRKSSRS